MVYCVKFYVVHNKFSVIHKHFSEILHFSSEVFIFFYVTIKAICLSIPDFFLPTLVLALTFQHVCI
jgi:hypothetical protein